MERANARRIRPIVCGCACAVLVLPAIDAAAQSYPAKTVRIVVGGSGGGSDTTARMLSVVLAGPLGQQVVVDNRPSGIIPGDIVAKAAPDGYTLLVTGSSLWVSPLLQSVPFDPVKDFTPVRLRPSRRACSPCIRRCR